MSKGKILVIEPDFDIRYMLKVYFSGQGYEINTVENGKDALESLRQQLPNLILMGNDIPDIDGFGLCIKLRTTSRTKFIPIIFLTQKDEHSVKLLNTYCMRIIF